MSRDELLDQLLADLQGQTLPAVRVPGPQAVRRMVMRRQRNRMAAAALAAVVAVGGALGAYISTRPRPAQAPAAPAASAPSPSRPAPSAASGSDPEPSSPPASGDPGPMPADLHLSGPTGLILTPGHTTYRGTLTLTLHNTGPIPYGQTLIYLSYPDGVHYQFPDQPLWGPCLDIQGDEPWVCFGPAVSARGGTMRITWAITIDYAPGPALTLPQPFTFRAVAAALTSDQKYRDPTPADNRISVTLKLAAAS